ncbi:S9 family peptidase [Paenibacillus sp. FSL H7-0326]|uniref:S9 family peptidase n=1 Tax=Paenibacillus sp. FSL H7-0326 TaxID=1921144 RepID=UPI00096EEE49|nr:S9 family peptidase [Paenibacillus sp. FSL H7-0326]OMC65498.1 S9 family peptidase [Paenibacillus sp. FSL H7-0326]
MINFPVPDVAQFFQTSVIRYFTVTKDESRLLFNSNLNGQPNLWAMDLPGGFPYPLTYENQSGSFIKTDPNGEFILADFDKDGDENLHLYLLKPSGGKPVKIVPGEADDKFYFVKLSKDGKRIYYDTSKDNPVYLNSRCLDLESGQDELLHEGADRPTYLAAISPDEKRRAYLKMFSNTHQSLLIQSNGETEVKYVFPEDEVQVIRSVTFIDDDTLLFVTNQGKEFSYAAEYNISRGEVRTVQAFDQEEVGAIEWHKESQTLYLVTSVGIENRMYAVPYGEEGYTSVPLPVDFVEQISVAESGNVYILGRGAVKPFNIYRHVNGEWEQLTNNVVVGLTEEDLCYPDVVSYTSFDGMEIEALLFKAKPETANGYTVFWPHGGPQASEGKFFRPMFQFLLARGYNIFAPNFRGSAGYGATFIKLVEGDWGEGPRLDCVAGIEWLFEQGISSPDRLFIVGGSYGGYMTLLLAGRHPELFRAAVDIFGPSNLFTFIESVPDSWKPMMEQWLGDPVKDRERLIKDSPITYLKQMVKPMLVIQGANDPRVVQAESDQIVAALQEQGTEVEYIVLEDEGHGFSRKANEILVYTAMADFLDKHQASVEVHA